MRALPILALLPTLLGCASPRGEVQPPARPAMTEDYLKTRREAMVREQIAARGVADPRVLAAMARVPRHRFVDASQAHLAYEDSPLPLAGGQTISQPFIVAYMSEAAAIEPGDRVLEIGTGSGYQAAVLAELARDVYTIEIIPELAASAQALLAELGYANVHSRAGNGYLGWPERAPFDAILVTAAPDEIPRPLLDQLAVGGKLVIPLGTRSQEMTIVERTPAGFVERRTMPVRFVPMTGRPGASP